MCVVGVAPLRTQPAVVDAQKRGLLLGTGERDPEVVLGFGGGRARHRIVECTLDACVIQRNAVDPTHCWRRLSFGQELYRTDAVPADACEQVEGRARFGVELVPQAVPDQAIVGKEVVEEMLDARPAVQRAGRAERQGQGKWAGGRRFEPRIGVGELVRLAGGSAPVAHALSIHPDRERVARCGARHAHHSVAGTSAVRSRRTSSSPRADTTR